jgi:hypothetical protein
MADDGGEETDGAVRTLVQRLADDRRNAVQMRPDRGFPPGLAAGTARQAEAQQRRGIVDAAALLALAPDRVGAAGKLVEVRFGGQPGRYLGP